MPLQTDLSVSPYFDDYREENSFYKILFRPGVSVQARELNQLQSILQNQIERFGDNVFKRGTIIDGCDITFHPNYMYVKIKDNQTDSTPVNVNMYYGYYVRNSANVQPLVAAINNVVEGYETTDPDLNTLYVRYLNTGYANNGGVQVEQTQFSANQILTVYNPRNVIEKVIVNNGSAGFSNNDSVIIVPSMAIQNSSGGVTFATGFANGDTITDGIANAQIIEVDTTTNSEVVILKLNPIYSDLRIGNTQLWAFSENTFITSSSNSSVQANVVSIYGAGAVGGVVTGGLGDVDYIFITSKGLDYDVDPHVTISSKTATQTQVQTLSLTPQRYLAQVTVANTLTNPIGSGYAMTVGEGIVYQKGYFTLFNENLTIVSKYSNTPDALAVGFDTSELIINSNQDPSLLDNATGAPNYTAPGANRLKLSPFLKVLPKAEADANNDFLSIAEFSDGNPYKQNRQTVYNILGNELARRTYEESGNYVLDQFLLNTSPADTFAEESNTFNINIDPGVAYIKGNRVETVFNYETAIEKGINAVSADVSISLNYGNYIRVRELAGIFPFYLGVSVNLYDTAKQYITTSPGTTVTSAGTLIGTARIRSLVLEDGVPGSATAVYRMYLFDIRMNSGKNFSSVRSVFYDGTTDAIADLVLEGGSAVLKGNDLSTLMYNTGRDAIASGNPANNVSYVYRTLNNGLTIEQTTGTITISSGGTETFPYTKNATLSAENELDLIIIPSANVRMQNSISGSISCNSTSLNINGTSTQFTTTLEAGDFIRIANSTANVVIQVNSISNDTVLIAKSLPANPVTAGNATVYFPQNVPISLKGRNTLQRTANVNSTGTTMIVSLGAQVNATTSVAVAYNLNSANTIPVTKTPTRNVYVRMRLSDNAGKTSGPWALGVPDVFRLRNVYLGSNSTFTPTATGVSNITDEFYIDHNQTEDYYGISYLYKKPNSSTTLTSADFLLVRFDYFVHGTTGGLKFPGMSNTYNIDDTIEFTSATSTINTLEIPEVYSNKGAYYDLRDCYDFRPVSANTVAPVTLASVASAPVNPTEPSNANRFDSTNKYFPAPDSALTGSVTYYQGRQDRVIVDEEGEFRIIRGQDDIYTPPEAPAESLTVNILNIPPYPSHPYKLSANTIKYADTNMASERYTTRRIKNYRISTLVDEKQRERLQPRGYTMEEIGNLERRIESLEYYTQLSLTESRIQKKSIPSSTDATLERFKFGFFVDSFETTNYSDIDSPAYNAAVVDGYLAPAIEELVITAVPSVAGIVSLPFNEVTLVSQLQATVNEKASGPVVVVDPSGNSNTASNTTTSNTTTSNTTASNTATTTSKTYYQIIREYIVGSKNTVRSDTADSTKGVDEQYPYEDRFINFSRTRGPVELYLNSRDNNIAIAIYQRTSATAAWTRTYTSATAQAITAADIATRKLQGLNRNTTIEHPGTLSRQSYGPFGGYIEDQFKLTWTHDPALGREYRIRVFKGLEQGVNGYPGTFAYKLYYPYDTEEDPTSTAPSFKDSSQNAWTTTTNFEQQYIGVFTPSQFSFDGIDLSSYPISIPQQSLDYIRSIGTQAASTAYTPRSTVRYIVNEQAYDFSVSGLKPNTVHSIKLDNKLITNATTSKVKQDGKRLGDELRSDANGVIDFKLYISADIDGTNSLQYAAQIVSQGANRKVVKIYNTDNTSVAETTIELPDYIRETSNKPQDTSKNSTKAASTGLDTSGALTIVAGGSGQRERFAEKNK